MFSFLEFIVLTTCCERTEVTCYSMNVDTHSINAISDLKKHILIIIQTDT